MSALDDFIAKEAHRQITEDFAYALNWVRKALNVQDADLDVLTKLTAEKLLGRLRSLGRPLTFQDVHTCMVETALQLKTVDRRLAKVGVEWD